LTMEKLKEIAAEKKEESETICDDCKQVPIWLIANDNKFFYIYTLYIHMSITI
jgi:hypothetical protein